MLSCAPAELLSFAFDPQAGGGGSFGGGGGGGGGGGSGGGGDGIELVFWLIRLAFHYPKLGLPALAVVAVVFVMGVQRGWWKHQERVIRRATPRRRVQTTRDAAARLRRSDPAFDEVRFLTRVTHAFRLAQDSWCAQALEPLRPFVSDGVFERFSLQIEEQQADGWRQGMQGLELQPLGIVEVSTGAHFETLTVRIPFRADIHRLQLDGGERVRGSKLPREDFSECWSFVRRRGTRTLSGQGLIEGHCPNCGAPLVMNQAARCASCQAFVRSGQYDWVLAEITQASEWQPTRAASVPGLATLARSDPGLDVQVLEDRVSVAFWRAAAAERRARVDPLLRIATPELCARRAAELERQAGQARTRVDERAVGSVRTLGFLPAAPADGQETPARHPALERAVVEVVWDGRVARVAPDGQRRLEPGRRLERSLFVLTRPPGTRTSLEQAFTTATCRTCGARDLGGTDATCPYCGAPRTGGESWLVDAIFERGSSGGSALLGELARQQRLDGSAAAPRPSAEGLFAWLGALLRADGGVDEREERAARRLAERYRIAPERVAFLMRADLERGVVPQPADSHQASLWLAALVEAGLCDGSLSRAERRLLRSAAERLGLGRRALARELRRARRELYRASRAAPAVRS